MASEDVTDIFPAGASTPFTRSSSFMYVASDYSDTCQDRMVSFRKDEAYTDVIVKTQHAKIPCHKVVLAAGSEYFHTLFRGGVHEPSPRVFEVSLASADILEPMIDFFYTGKILITTENVQEICQACHLLKLEHLEKACDKFIEDKIEPSNCLGMYMFGKMNNLKMTLNATNRCMLTRPKDILTLAVEAEYRKLGEEELIRYISNDNLEVEDESDVFHLVEKWVMADKYSRKPAFERLLEHVRLPFCTVSFLCNVVEACPLADTQQCRLLISEAKNCHLFPEIKQDIKSPRTKPRRYCRCMVVMGGKNDGGVNRSCWYMKMDGNKWEELSQFPTSKACYFQAQVLENDIIVTGGCLEDNKKSTSECWLLDVSGKKWKPLPPLLEARSAHIMVCNRDDVYVFGGWNGSYMGTCEMMDSKKEKWVNVKPLINPTENATGVAYEGYIYIMAGSDTPQTNQCFCIATGEWQKKADLPIKCSGGPSAVLVNNTVFVTGGSVCLSYHPGQDSWTVLTMPLEQHVNASATVWKGRIVVGGGDQKKKPYTDVMEEYDPHGNKWSMWKLALPKPLRGHCLLNIPNIV